MPDAPGLELLAKELGDAALETVYSAAAQP